jgi:catechol 2,3-dioxygenase-like lactoylglutathione lyase family enzyme
MAALHHVGLVVADLDRSLAFYVGALGLTLAIEPGGPGGGVDVDAALQLTGVRLRGAWLAAGATFLELLQFDAPTSPGVTAPHTIGAQHLSFEVSDIRAERARLEALGVAFVNDIRVVDSGRMAGLRTCYFLDPDGIRVELIEIAAGPLGSPSAP